MGVSAAGSDLKAVPRPQLHIFAKKTISLLDGPQTVISAKAWSNWDPQASKVSVM